MPSQVVAQFYSVKPLDTKCSPTLTARKYVILFGLGEFPRGTSRSARLDEHLKKAIFVLSKADQSNTIKDIYHLGRFTAENRKPRPILVKFI